MKAGAGCISRRGRDPQKPTCGFGGLCHSREGQVGWVRTGLLGKVVGPSIEKLLFQQAPSGPRGGEGSSPDSRPRGGETPEAELGWGKGDWRRPERGALHCGGWRESAGSGEVGNPDQLRGPPSSGAQAQLLQVEDAVCQAPGTGSTRGVRLLDT